MQEKEREAGAQSGCHAIDRQTEAAPVVNDFAYFAYDAMLLGAIALNRSLGENGSVSASLSAIRRLGTGSGGGSDMVTATGTFEMSEVPLAPCLALKLSKPLQRLPFSTKDDQSADPA